MKILFKNTLLVTIGICIGILVASIGVVVYSGLNIFLKSRVINISSEEMISKTSIIGIQIPEKAYNIDFYYDEWQDYTCWVAFSASDEEIQEVIQGLNIQKQNEYKSTPYMPKDKNGRALLGWWPESTKNFEIYYGQFCWMGYDKKNSGLYIYKFST